jgi:hypothetical protein
VYGKSYCEKFGGANFEDISDLQSSLQKMQIPTPDSFVKLAKNPDSLPDKLDGGDAEQIARSNLRFFESTVQKMPVPYDPLEKHTMSYWQDIRQLDDTPTITCSELLHTLVQGIRWEAGHAYNQIARQSIDEGIPFEYIPYDFTYGWDFGDKVLNTEDQEQYLIHLIILHIFRNEMMMAPTGTDNRWTASEKSLDYSKAYQRSIGSKNKAGELATWTKLMPYVQGAVLYLITAAYPFCVVVMVVPGWHKVLATWAGFFTWVKSWDFGFAFVNSLERSVWAIIGNDEQQQTLNRYIYRHIHEGASMANDDAVYGCDPAGPEYLGKVNLLGCEDGKGGIVGGIINAFDDNKGKACMVPQLKSHPFDYSEVRSLAMWDEMMILAPYLDLDLKNSYYIYLMSALYFAVPMVTGQIFLGAKAGAAQMLSGFSSAAQGAGERGGAGYTNEIQARAKQAESNIGQMASSKALRASTDPTTGKATIGGANSFGSQALSASNAGADNQLASAKNQGEGTMLGQESQAVNDNANQQKQELQAGASGWKAGQTGKANKNEKAIELEKLAAGVGSSPTGSGGTSTGGSATPADKSNETPSKTPKYRPNGNTPEAVKQGGEALVTHQANSAQSDIRQKQAENALQGLGLQGEGSRLQNLGQRSDAQANFAAAQGRYDGVRDWANQMNSRVGGLGVLAGSISPPAKPTDTTGLALNGNLGKDAQQKANYFGDGGAYSNNINKAQSDLSSNNNSGGWQTSYNGAINLDVKGGKREIAPPPAKGS